MKTPKTLDQLFTNYNQQSNIFFSADSTEIYQVTLLPAHDFQVICFDMQIEKYFSRS